VHPLLIPSVRKSTISALTPNNIESNFGVNDIHRSRTDREEVEFAYTMLPVVLGALSSSNVERSIDDVPPLASNVISRSWCPCW
jgi:hypothetical protein